MLQKIRYRLAFNRAARLNRQGEGLVQVECAQNGRRIYFSTHVYVLPEHWSNGRITGIPNAELLNYAMYRQLTDVERIELEYIRREVNVTLGLLREAVISKTSPAARLSDFGREAVKQSDRKRLTIANYETLLRNVEKFRHGVLLSEIDYTFITTYNQWLVKSGVAHNTRVSRMRMLRALLNEAVRRDLIATNPFDRYRLQGMISKQGHLTEAQLSKLEQMALTGIEDRVRDAFLVGCYTGLRFSDIVTLTQSDMRDGWIVKRMKKTGFIVEIPVMELFGEKFQRLLDKYGGDIERLTRHVPCNSKTNQTLRALLDRIHADRKATFHTSRHTFATLLGQRGVPMTTTQHLLGHQRIETTQIYQEHTRKSILNSIRKNHHRKNHYKHSKSRPRL